MISERALGEVGEMDGAAAAIVRLHLIPRLLDRFNFWSIIARGLQEADKMTAFNGPS